MHWHFQLWRFQQWLKRLTKRTIPSPTYLGTIKVAPSELPRILGMPIVFSNYVPPGQILLVPFSSLRLEDAITAWDQPNMGSGENYIVAHVGMEEELEKMFDDN